MFCARTILMLRVQAIHLCTATRAKKVVAGFTVLVLGYATIWFIAWLWHLVDVVEVFVFIDSVLFRILVPCSGACLMLLMFI